MKFFLQNKRNSDKKKEEKLPPRAIVEVALTIFVIFLSSILFFGIGSGKIDARTIMISLLLTYIILQYWLGRVVRSKASQKSAIEK